MMASHERFNPRLRQSLDANEPLLPEEPPNPKSGRPWHISPRNRAHVGAALLAVNPIGMRGGADAHLG